MSLDHVWQPLCSIPTTLICLTSKSRTRTPLSHITVTSLLASPPPNTAFKVGNPMVGLEILQVCNKKENTERF
ncbi:hypothetical protein CCACVL1_25260 [Corchorus capsularis]|uniref:Uncharacterized protein n=1 Tax=Corchorus capsularis TaxID=210143 RepID=A0A1R3GLE1_COCAP|nr:hypothetical protein CCACVL1_25260 [Corchorus capsularis]